MAYRSKTNNPKSGVSRITSKAITKPTRVGSDQIQTGFIPNSLNFNSAGDNSERIVLSRDVFNRAAFNNTVDTNFSQLDQEAPDLSFFEPNLATVEDFFNIYENLFFQIPKYGENNSHQYLVVESTAYTGFIENQEQIDALLEEITDLREENLQLQLDIGQLLGAKETLDQAIALDPNNSDSSLEDLVNAEAAAGAAQSNSSSDLLTTSNNTTSGVGSGGGGGGGNRPQGITNGLIGSALASQVPGGAPVPVNPIAGSNINPGNSVY